MYTVIGRPTNNQYKRLWPWSLVLWAFANPISPFFEPVRKNGSPGKYRKSLLEVPAVRILFTDRGPNWSSFAALCKSTTPCRSCPAQIANSCNVLILYQKNPSLLGPPTPYGFPLLSH